MSSFSYGEEAPVHTVSEIGYASVRCPPPAPAAPTGVPRVAPTFASIRHLCRGGGLPRFHAGSRLNFPKLRTTIARTDA